MTNPLTDTGPTAPPRSQWLDVWDQFKTHKGALAGAVVFLTIIVLALFGPFFWNIDPSYIDIRARNQGMSWDLSLIHI